MKDYLTLAEASELIGKSKETLRRWDREGKLSAVREPISNYRVYRKSEVLSLFSVGNFGSALRKKSFPSKRTAGMPLMASLIKIG